MAFKWIVPITLTTATLAIGITVYNYFFNQKKKINSKINIKIEQEIEIAVDSVVDNDSPVKENAAAVDKTVIEELDSDSGSWSFIAKTLENIDTNANDILIEVSPHGDEIIESTTPCSTNNFIDSLLFKLHLSLNPLNKNNENEDGELLESLWKVANNKQDLEYLNKKNISFMLTRKLNDFYLKSDSLNYASIQLTIQILTKTQAAIDLAKNEFELNAIKECCELIVGGLDKLVLPPVEIVNASFEWLLMASEHYPTVVYPFSSFLLRVLRELKEIDLKILLLQCLINLTTSNDTGNDESIVKLLASKVPKGFDIMLNCDLNDRRQPNLQKQWMLFLSNLFECLSNSSVQPAIESLRDSVNYVPSLLHCLESYRLSLRSTLFIQGNSSEKTICSLAQKTQRLLEASTPSQSKTVQRSAVVNVSPSKNNLP